jgi:nucleotide-binding universal stress UspA family protein
VTIAFGALLVLVVVLGAALAWSRVPPRLERQTRVRRVLVPFTGGALDEHVLSAAIRIARAEEATLVPAYLIVVPLELAENAPMQKEVAVAMPLLEAVEHAALRAGVPVDARVESGRTPVQALRRLWEAERFDRIVVPAPAGRPVVGFSPKDLTWMLTNAPSETLILRPTPA